MGCYKARMRRVPSHPLCPAGHLPRKGGDWLSRRLSPISDTAIKAPTAKLVISPLAGEMAGRPEGGAVPPASITIRRPIPLYIPRRRRLQADPLAPGRTGDL
ncbi:hypothetical protein EJ071_30240 [Mesorhizobium sp. M1B.F.Ca.ET.045.04.1.1]|nr:hypothetical protein EJ071_30240 [Mesorhizobium sp. M1B.F.Ca.ET.045.04.1.1]